MSNVRDISRLADPGYPWRELFPLLCQAGYDRFTLAELQDSPDRERLLKYQHHLGSSEASRMVSSISLLSQDWQLAVPPSDAVPIL